MEKYGKNTAITEPMSCWETTGKNVPHISCTSLFRFWIFFWKSIALRCPPACIGRSSIHKKNVGTSPSCTEKKADTSPSASTNQQYKYVLTALKSGNQADLVKAIRTLYGCGRDEGKRWAESSQLIIMQTNDKNKVTEAVNIFEGEYGIKVTINGKSKP